MISAEHSTSSTSSDEPLQKNTKNVDILRGDPKKSIIALSLPMIAAMLLTSLYNVVNAIWVAGLGSDALAAVGIITPVFMIMMGIGAGIGTGTTAAIARRIGAHDKNSADNTAAHAILINLVLGLILTILGYIFLEDVLILMGAGDLVSLAVTYGNIIILGTIFILFCHIMYGILRGEGDVKRTMYAMVISSILNIILDPFLIYTCKMGIAGAAWGTVISILFVCILLVYWTFIKRDTYISVTKDTFSYKKEIIFDILRVGIPASIEFLAMATMSFFVNWMLITTDGADAVAVFTGGWRFVMIAMVPLIAIGMAVTAISGAMYGAKRFTDLKEVLLHGVKFSLAIAVGIAILTYICAPYMAYLFAYSEGSTHLLSGMSEFLRLMILIYPFAAFGIVASCLFQGVGKGFTALGLNLLRNLVLISLSAYILGMVLDLKSLGIWWGVIIGDMAGGTLGFCIALLFLRTLLNVANHADKMAK